MRKEELIKVEGGSFKIIASKWLFFGGATSFVIGFLSGLVRPYPCTSKKWSIMSEQELLSVHGGSVANATFINSLVKGASFLYDLGRSFGSAFRRILKRNYC